MADLKITQLNNNTAIAGTDLVVIVDDPGGTPVTEKRTVSDLFKVPHHIYDPNGNIIAFFDYSASAVNYVYFDNNAAGAGPDVGAAGTDTNIDLNIFAKGTGVVKVTGGNGIDLNNKTLDNALRINYDRAAATVVAGGNLGATETIDWATGTHFTGTLDSNITFTYSNAVAGQSITLYLSYDGTATRTITWPTTTWLDNGTGAAPTAPGASGNVLVVTVFYDGTTYLGSATGNYSVYS